MLTPPEAELVPSLRATVSEPEYPLIQLRPGDGTLTRMELPEMETVGAGGGVHGGAG
jgi:hypothetical protein